MTAKTTAERVAAMRAAREAQGLKRLDVYAHPDDHPAIKALAEKLQRKRQLPIGPKPVPKKNADEAKCLSALRNYWGG